MADQPYYNVGTATLTVGSTSMVGQGTLWVGNARPGDVVFGRAGERNIIVDVVDNTHVVLLFPATVAQAALGYAIMYTPDDPFTQTELRKILKGMSASALLALSNLAPAARKGIRFDGAANAALIDISDAALTLLDDPDIATMRSTLDVAQKQASLTDTTAGRSLLVGGFGIGGKTPVLASPNLNTPLQTGEYYITNAANGPTVGVSGYLSIRNLNDLYQVQEVNVGYQRWRRELVNGTPTAWRANFEFGSNANGVYIKHESGLLVCLTQTTVFLDTNLYQAQNLPSPFVNTNYGAALTFATSASSGDTSIWLNGQERIVVNPLAASQVGFVVRNATLPASGVVNAAFTGRWF